jgi:hypothetical protein
MSDAWCVKAGQLQRVIGSGNLSTLTVERVSGIRYTGTKVIDMIFFIEGMKKGVTPGERVSQVVRGVSGESD